MNKRLQEALIQDILDGDCTPEDLVLFQECFRGEEDFRKRYYQYARMDVLLSADHNQQWDLTRSRGEHYREVQTRRNIRVAFLSAAALVAISLFAAWFVQVRNAARAGGGIMIVYGGDAHWSLSHPDDEQDQPASRELRTGSTLTLEQGLAELSLPSGVWALVSGPAVMTMTSEDHVRLETGKARFRVPKEQAGFTVTTPELRIVDLGTEFGVRSRDGAPDELHVFEGRVEVRALAGHKERTILTAGEALAVRPVGSFRRDLKLADDYPESVAGGLPYLHWPFDTQEDGRLKTEGTHPQADSVRAGLIQAPGRQPADRLRSGAYGQAVSFEQRGDVISMDFPGFSGAAPRTVAFWIRIPKDTRMRSDYGVTGWGLRHSPKASLNEAWLFILHAQNGQFHPKISFEGIWYTGETDLGGDQWRHVACVYTGKSDPSGAPEVLCYVDGRPERLSCHWVPSAQFDPQTPAKINTRTDAPDSVPLEIGTSLIPKITRGGGENFEGRIDEVFLIQGAVDAETVQSLYRENRYVPTPPREVPPSGAPSP